MPDGIEQEAINKLTSVGSVLKNPFSALEEILAVLGNQYQEPKYLRESHYQNESKLRQSAYLKEVDENYSIESFNQSSNESLGKILSELGDMFQFCGHCGKGTLKDELIDNICFDCNTKREQMHAENERLIYSGSEGERAPLVNRIGKLEAQIEDMKSKYEDLNSSPRDYLGDVVEEILSTIRKDIRSEIDTMKRSMTSIQTPPVPGGISSVPPPPPPPTSHDKAIDEQTNQQDIDFSKMRFATLKKFTPEFLESLPISKRNQYNTRLKELQLLRKMTPKQKKAYYAKKKREKEQAAELKNFKDSLKNLSDSDNPLFKKMKEKADRSVLVGKGTLGNLGSKKIYIHCHKCNKTNEILEESEAICKYCKTPLNLR